MYIFWIALLHYIYTHRGSNLEDQKPSDHPQQLHDTTIQAKIITTLQQETVPAPILSFLRCGNWKRQGFGFPSGTGDTQMMKNHFKFSGFIHFTLKKRKTHEFHPHQSFCSFSSELTAWSTKKSASPTSWNIAIPYSQKHPIRSGSNPSKQSSKIQLFGLRLGG